MKVTAMPPPPEFIFLDVGNVLVSFDHARGLRQIAAASGVDLPDVEAFFVSRDLQQRLEAGAVSWPAAHAEFCQLTGSAVPLSEFSLAAGDIFSLRAEMLPVLAALRRLQMPVGLLSNSCEPHWQFICASRYAFLPAGTAHRLQATTRAKLNLYEKAYQPLADVAPPPVVIAREQDVEAVEFLGDPNLLLRTLLPNTPSFDMAVVE